MTSEFTQGETYFIEVPEQVLNTTLPDSVKEKFGYPLDEVFYLGDCVNKKKQLLNGNWAISIQICRYSEFNSKSVYGKITEGDFNLAKEQFQVTEFLTLAEYQALPQPASLLL